ncbi:PEX11 domain-containing protein [Rhizoctonia solani AG-1 IA]|uniref:PEX11 domain-containing protein n=1 Tax=Thanatephorus cucumeris (strain AG1-IA) TaxID=983506 RepID=L8WEW5_THACA|nr:PEX11 domain-containing protein [Rhizoctonia solani AG-1 IA]
MAAVASQIVLHPLVSHSIKLLGTTLGRDKIYRTVQYFARFLAWVLLTRGHKLEASRWNSLKNALASVMRLMKPVEHLQAALRASQLSTLRSYPIEQYTTIARQISYAGYLSLDAVVWVCNSRGDTRRLDLTECHPAQFYKGTFGTSRLAISLADHPTQVARLANEAKRLRSASEKGVGADADRSSKAMALDMCVFFPNLVPSDPGCSIFPNSWPLTPAN